MARADREPRRAPIAGSRIIAFELQFGALTERMPQLAKGYTDEQIEIVAAWFAAQKGAK